MSIGQDKTRIVITIPKDVHEKIKQAAKQDNRTMSNWIVNALLKGLKEGK